MTIFLVVAAMAAAAYAEEIRDEGIIATAPPEAYAGSVRCGECHPDQHAQWSKTLKARFVRYRDESAPLPGKWNPSPIFKDRDSVSVVVGLNRKVAFVDSEWRVLGAEYRYDKEKWKRKKSWRGWDYRQRCGMCHLTGCNPYDKRFTELGVGCEACHGPGKAHVDAEGNAPITVPGRDGQDVLDTCRRCHNSRNNHADAIRHFDGSYHHL